MIIYSYTPTNPLHFMIHFFSSPFESLKPGLWSRKSNFRLRLQTS